MVQWYWFPNKPRVGGPVYAVEDGGSCHGIQPSTDVFRCFLFHSKIGRNASNHGRRVPR